MSAIKLRPFQQEALSALKKTGHIICLAPTGSGKSLIFEQMALRQDIRMVLVSPLIALARQQKERLLELGIQTRLAAGHDPEGPPDPGPGVWIISPERLHLPKAQRALARWNANFLVVDECHCLWDWGESFRPAFNSLPEVLRLHPFERSLWLTATLPRDARDELVAALPQPVTLIGSFKLPARLRLSVRHVPWPERTFQLLNWVLQKREAGIIFVQTRESALRITRLIEATGRKCLLYHAGMSTEERLNTERKIASQAMLHSNEVIVATSAFGMGMNHPHLRWSLLWQAPNSLLALAQAIGRVGRDAHNEAEACVFWDPEDFRFLEWTVRGSARSHKELRLTHEFLSRLNCRTEQLERYFNDTALSIGCAQCDFCLNLRHAKNAV